MLANNEFIFFSFKKKRLQNLETHALFLILEEKIQVNLFFFVWGGNIKIPYFLKN